jgi:hypothetical protein
MNYIKHIFSYDFLFYVNPVRLGVTDQVFAGAAVLAIVVAIIAKLYVRFSKNEVSRKLAHRLSVLFATVGALGVLWYGARYQNANVFGTRFAFLCIAVVGLVWFSFIAKYWWKQYRPEKLAWEKEQVKLKYLNQ